jgi:hypothetical protein
MVAALKAEAVKARTPASKQAAQKSSRKRKAVLTRS